MGTITRHDLARILAGKMDCSVTEAERLVNAFFQAMTRSASMGNKIEARGFGAFVVSETRARMCHNPITDGQVYLPARKKVVFRPGTVLKEALMEPIDEKSRGQTRRKSEGARDTGH